MINARKSFVSLAALAGLFVIAAFVLLGTGRATGEPANRPGLESAALSSAVSKIGLLREARSSAANARAAHAGVPATDADVNGTPLLGGHDIVDLEHIVRAKLGAGARAQGGGVFVAPTKNGNELCVIAPGRMGCASSDVIDSKGAALTVNRFADGTIFVTGLTTDAVGEIAVSSKASETQRLTPSSNVVSAQLPDDAKAITWTGPAGTESLPVVAERSGR